MVDVLKVLLVLSLTVVFLTSCASDPSPDKPDDNYGNYYEIFVASFYDSNEDGMGDINGIIKKMEYLNDGNSRTDEDLMIDGIWLMPIMPSPSYHKYDVIDYMNVDEAYGTLEDFEKLMEVTEKAKVKVIIDLVVNHSSVEHPWFLSAVESLKKSEDNPYIDYYHFTSEPDLPNYHQVEGLPGYYYEGAFGRHMPDLNLDNDALRQELIDIASFWMEMGVDGFRLDAVTHYYEGNSQKNTAFLAWLHDELTKINDDVYIVGEAWSDGGTIETLYQSGIDSFFNFPFSGGRGDIIMDIKIKKGNDLAKSIEAWQDKMLEANGSAIDAVFLSNHDNARSGGALNRDVALQKMGANVYFLMPGNAFVYYGEEIGMTGSGKDENKRQPFLWSTEDMTGMTEPPIGSDEVLQKIEGLDVQLQDEHSLVNHYKKLFYIKNKYPEIMRGNVAAMEFQNTALCAYETTWNHDGTSERVYIIHNFAEEAAEVDLGSFDGAEIVETVYCSDGSVEEENQVATVPAKTTIILK